MYIVDLLFDLIFTHFVAGIPNFVSYYNFISTIANLFRYFLSHKVPLRKHCLSANCNKSDQVNVDLPRNPEFSNDPFRNYAAFDLMENGIYVYHGYVPGEELERLWKYNFATKRWSESHVPGRESKLCMVPSEHNDLLFLHIYGNLDRIRYNRVLYHPTSEECETLATTPLLKNINVWGTNLFCAADGERSL